MDDFVRFEPEWAETVAGWPLSASELSGWASRDDFPLPVSALSEWHADPDVRAFVLVSESAPLAYGELWLEPGDGEVELARLIVAPGARRSGLGVGLVEHLVHEARTLGRREAWLRVVPTNHAALACYRKAGFERTSPSEERVLNEAQPRAYQWLRRTLA